MIFLTDHIFCKQSACPSAEMLLSYATGLVLNQRAWIASHLAACDFCGAELQLLTKHPPAEEECGLTEIPLNLRHLAEALLSNDLQSLGIYAEVTFEKERLTFTDA